MELVFSTRRFASLGGSETYVLTVAQQLERLGHTVTVHAEVLGEMAEIAARRGVPVAEDEASLPARPNAVFVQDGVSSLKLADRYPEVRQVFVCHADAIDLQMPPQLPGVVSKLVVFNDRVQRRMAALSERAPIVRLRQPVDVDWFTPNAPIRASAERVLVFSSYMRGPRRELVERVCLELGLACRVVGSHGEVLHDPRGAILDADIVIGYGRSILEAMASGRAAYVLDHKGGDGWVTPDRYPALEADGFGGRAEPAVVSSERVRQELGLYDPEMGIANRDLAVLRHAAHTHAADLVKVLEAPEPSRRDPGLPLREVARLTRRQSETEARVAALMLENEGLRNELNNERRLAASHYADVENLRSVFAELKGTRRYRMASALAKPLDALRRRRRDKR